MKTEHVIELLLLAFAIAGAFAFFYHRNQPAIYVVLEIEEITSAGGNGANADGSTAGAATVLRSHNGVYLAGTERITAFDGRAPKRVVIARFSNAEEARAWYNSPEEREIDEIRLHNTKSRLFTIEGD